MATPRAAKRSVRSQLADRAKIAVANRRVFPYLVGVTALTVVAAGFVVHLVDRKDFPTFGVGVWWSVVTLGTVGYGDVVPHTAWGRVLGGIVILFGVTFISFLIAIVTSLFVDADRADEENALQARHDEILTLLQTMNGRLEALEKRVGPMKGTP